MIHGAKVLQVKGNFDEALEFVLKLGEKHKDIYLLNSINPFRIEGQKSLGYEICEQLNYEAPDRIIIPVGNAGNISAVWKGLKEFYELRPNQETAQNDRHPSCRLRTNRPSHQSQQRQNRPSRTPRNHRHSHPHRRTSQLEKSSQRHPRITRHSRNSNRRRNPRRTKTLARIEGIFVEPASASSIAGLKKLIKNGTIIKDEKVVCITTGHGLKDPDTAIKQSEKPIEVDADITAIEAALGLKQSSTILAR